MIKSVSKEGPTQEGELPLIFSEAGELSGSRQRPGGRRVSGSYFSPQLLLLRSERQDKIAHET